MFSYLAIKVSYFYMYLGNVHKLIFNVITAVCSVFMRLIMLSGLLSYFQSNKCYFLWSASIGSALGLKPLHVHLEPTTNLRVCEGASVGIKCIWNQPDNVKMSWYFSKNASDGCNLSSINNGTSFLFTITDTWSILTNPHIRTNESGWYFCKVTKDIPYLKENCSNGLHVLVGKLKAMLSDCVHRHNSVEIHIHP